MSRYNAVLGMSSYPYANQQLTYNPILDSTDVLQTLISATDDDFWNIQNLAMLAISRYNGDFQNEILFKVDSLVTFASSSKVRAKALEFLSTNDSIAKNYVQLYQSVCALAPPHVKSADHPALERRCDGVTLVCNS